MDRDELIRPVGPVRATRAIRPVSDRGRYGLRGYWRVAIRQARAQYKRRLHLTGPTDESAQTGATPDETNHATSGNLGRLIDTKA